MATKRIARTVIEGGRTTWNKNERRQSNRAVRKHAKAITRTLSRLVDEDGYMMPERSPIRKEHADKLKVAMSWLIHHGLGKTPPEIEGLILSRFNTRTIAGRHIVFSHLMPELAPVSKPARWKRQGESFTRKVTGGRYTIFKNYSSRVLGITKEKRVELFRNRVAEWRVRYKELNHRRNFYDFLPENGFKLRLVPEEEMY